MLELSVNVTLASYAVAKFRLRNIRNGLPIAMAGAVNDTAKSAKIDLSRRIREAVNIKKRDIDRHIKCSRATPANPSSVVELSKTERLSLKYFGARRTNKGVTYKIDKKGKRSRVDSSFIVDKLGGHVYKRKGKKRLPIQKLFGPSAWGVAVEHDIPQQTQRDAKKDLTKNLKRRVNMLVLKSKGKI